MSQGPEGRAAWSRYYAETDAHARYERTLHEPFNGQCPLNRPENVGEPT